MCIDTLKTTLLMFYAFSVPELSCWVGPAPSANQTVFAGVPGTVPKHSSSPQGYPAACWKTGPMSLSVWASQLPLYAVLHIQSTVEVTKFISYEIS